MKHWEQIQPFKDVALNVPSVEDKPTLWPPSCSVD